MLQKILNLIDEVKISEVFADLEKLGVKSAQISKLKQEFIHGKIEFDFYDRLKMAVKHELKEEKGISDNPKSANSALLKDLYASLNQKLNDEQLNLFCMLHFDAVYNNFSLGQSKIAKISALLDYAKRNDLLEKLGTDLESF